MTARSIIEGPGLGGGRFQRERLSAVCYIYCFGQAPGVVHERVRAMSYNEVALP